MTRHKKNTVLLAVGVLTALGQTQCEKFEIQDSKEDDNSSQATYEVWCDASSGLCWQNPQRDAYNEKDIGLRYEEAILYCEELVLGGCDDWRLPTARELRTIIAGYPGTEPGGSCPIGGEKADITFMEGWGGGDCGFAPSLEGPGDGDCYTVPGIRGTCSKVDIYSHGHQMEMLALDVPSDDDPSNPQIATVMYDNAAVVWNHRCTLGEVRCVRTDDNTPPTFQGEKASCDAGEMRSCPCKGAHQSKGTQTCNANGQSFTPCDCAEFTPEQTDQPECHNMVCDSADRVRLKIDVEGWTDNMDSPAQLIAFWYSANGWSFPKARPPDGGTWTDQVVDPGPPPYVLEVPGCTYYQERLLEGDYYLMVILQMEERFPPIPTENDYWWGYTQNPTHFPFANSRHLGNIYELNITLTATSNCPNLCTETPADDDVITCRYESIFTSDNCADFKADEWTAEEVSAVCGAMQGADPETVVVTRGGGNSCLVQKGGCGVFSRCQGTYEDGRSMFAYGVPDSICTAFVPTEDEATTGLFDDNKPFCCAYSDKDCTDGSY